MNQKCLCENTDSLFHHTKIEPDWAEFPNMTGRESTTLKAALKLIHLGKTTQALSLNRPEKRYYRSKSPQNPRALNTA